MRLHNKVVVITGAAHGIGKAYARRFAEGHRAYVAWRDGERATDLDGCRDVDVAAAHALERGPLDVTRRGRRERLGVAAGGEHDRLGVSRGYDDGRARALEKLRKPPGFGAASKISGARRHRMR